MERTHGMDSRPDSRPDARSNARPNASSDARSTAPSDAPPKSSASAQPATQPTAQPATQPATQPARQPATQPAMPPATQSAMQPATRERAFGEMVARMAYLFKPRRPPMALAQWFAEWERLDSFNPRPCLRSEYGATSRFAIRQVAIGDASHLLVVIRLDLLGAERPGQPMAGSGQVRTASDKRPRPEGQEWLWPVDELPPTDIVYDCGDELLHGKAKPILCDLSTVPMRVFAILPTQIERLVVAREQGGGVLGAADASGRVIAARLPFQITPAAGRDSGAFADSARDGWLRVPFTDSSAERSSTERSSAERSFAERSSATTTLRIRCLLNGLTAVVRVRAEGKLEILDELWDPQPIRWA